MERVHQYLVRINPFGYKVSDKHLARGGGGYSPPPYKYIAVLGIVSFEMQYLLVPLSTDKF